MQASYRGILVALVSLIFQCFPWKAAATLPVSNPDIIQQEQIRTRFYEGMVHLYHFEYQQAGEDAAYLIKVHQASPWGHVLKANILWWRMITGDPADQSGNAFKSELDLAEKLTVSPQSPEGMYCLIVVNSLRSRYELMNRNYLSTILLLNKSRALIANAKGKEAEYEPFFLTQGLYEYFMATAKEKLGILSGLLPGGSNKARGLGYLQQLTGSENIVLQTEGNYFLMKIYLEMEKSPLKAYPYAVKLVKTFPDNLMFLYYKDKICHDLAIPEVQKVFDADGRMLIGNPQLSEKQINYFRVLLSQNK